MAISGNPRIRRGMVTGSWIRSVAAASCLALLGCQPSGDGTQPAEERKSPFATDNVSVAPQVEGRAAAPTAVPAPRPDTGPTPANP